MAEEPAGLVGTGLPRYLPVAEHGLIGNMRSVALVGTNGTIDWYCCPTFDAPSVFASILDADRGGCFELAAAVPARTKQFYFPDTNVLITRFLTEDAIGEIEDCMPISDSAESGRHRLIRRVLCVRGSLPFTARVAPRFDYARQPHTVAAMNGGVVFDSADLSLALVATVPLDSDGRDVTAEFELGEGESAVFALDRVGDDVEPRGCPHTEAREQFEATVAFWRRWLPASRYRGRWREVVHRSAPNCPNASCPTWQGTATPCPCGSATPPSTSCSWTSTASSSTPSTSTTSGASPSPATSGTGCATWWTGCASTGTSPTRASGRPAAAARSSCTPG